MSEITIGDVLRMRTWDDNRVSMKFSYGLGKQPKGKKTVALMLYLGQSPIDAEYEKESEYLAATMDSLGWVRKDGGTTTFRVALSPRGDHLWWTDSEQIPAGHAHVRSATDAEADLMARILRHDAAGRMPPKGLGDGLRALLDP
jgi:hypothetical protein